MDVIVKIDNEKVIEAVNKELVEFSKEELHTICTTALIEQLKDPKVFKSLFVTESPYYNSVGATDILKTAASKVDLSPLFKDFSDNVCTYLKENYKDLVASLFKEVLLRGLISNIEYHSDFRNVLNSMVDTIIQRKQ